RKLIDKLFFKGAEKTDTDEIRQHYKSVGFNPATNVESANKQTLQRFAAPEKGSVKNSLRIAAIIIGTAFLMIFAAFAGGNSPGVVAFGLFIGFFVLIFSMVAASVNARAVRVLIPRFALVALLLSPIVLFAAWYTAASVRLLLPVLTLAAVCTWAAMIVKLVLNALRSPESAETIGYRKGL